MKAPQKYGTLLGLYVAQSIPMSFFSTVVPVIMRQEAYSLESIGLLQLIKLPWVLKFLWAPLVDRLSPTIQHYRRWIFVSELFYALILLGIGFFDLAVSFRMIVALLVIAFTLSATQDIATDAFAIRILEKKQRGFGNSMQSSGSFIGTLFGSGVLLMLYPDLGWKGVIYLLVVILLVALLPLWIFTRKEPVRPVQLDKKVRWLDVLTFFGRPRMWKRILLLMLFYSGLIGMLSMFKPYMVDLGFDIPKIAFISGIYGTGLGVCCALAGGWVLKKWGQQNSLIRIAAFNLLAPIFFLIFNYFSLPDNWIYLGAFLLWGGYGMSSTYIYTICMNAVRKGREGTDYSIQIVITHLSGIFLAVISGKVGDALGYNGLFAMELVLGLLVLVLAPVLFHDPSAEEPDYERTA